MTDGFQIETSQNVALHYDLASLGDRILAYLIDALIVSFYAFIAIMVYMGLFSSVFEGGESISALFVILALILFLPAVCYHLLFEIFNNGQSLGKKALDIRVVAMNGGEVSVGSYLLRWLLRFVDISLFNGIVAIVAIAVSEKNQRVGDMVANTAVIKLKKRVQTSRIPYDPAPVEHEVRYPQSIRLSEDDISLIRETLKSTDVIDIDQQKRILADKVADILELPPPDNPGLFLRDVVKDYSHLRSF